MKSSCLYLKTMAKNELEAELWNGCVPVVVRLHPQDVTSLEQPAPYYAILPRMGYLGALAAAVVEHFKDAAPHCGLANSGTGAWGGLANDLWFDCNSTPLNWQVPAGVLFDAHSSSGAVRNNSSELGEQSPVTSRYPWALTVHFQSYPEGQLVRPHGARALERHFFHSLKQGLFLEHGSSAVAMQMERSEQEKLWRSVCDQDSRTFISVARRLRKPIPDAVPVRLLLQSIGSGRNSNGAAVWTQPHCKPARVDLGEAGTTEIDLLAAGTVGDLLHQCVDQSSDFSAAVDASCSSHDRSICNEVRSSSSSSNSSFVAVAHGVALGAAAPLIDVWRALAHPDHFLYLVVCPSTGN